MYIYTVQFAYSQKNYDMKHEPIKGAGKNKKLKHKKLDQSFSFLNFIENNFNKKF